ncbi:hypothetical protein HOY80DRAFT_955935 [Tuber brumale]|nr:hypothetical protein HOY80DRAFT_955935 [Tuber brumale]
MVGGGRGRGGPGGMAGPGRYSLPPPPQVQIPVYNPVVRPVPRIYQQQGGVQGFPPGPPIAPFGGVNPARPQQVGGGIFAPGRGSVVQNPRRSSAPMLGPGPGGMGNIPSYNYPQWQPPAPPPPRPPAQMVLPISTVSSQSYNNPAYRQQKILTTLIQQQEEDNRKRDTMRDQGLQQPASTHSNVSSREGSVFNAPSSNSSGLGLPYASTPTFQGSDRRSSTSSSIASSVYSRKAREEVLRRQQEEEEILQRQREEDKQRERLAPLVQDSATLQHLQSFPTSPTTPRSPGAIRIALAPGCAGCNPGTAGPEDAPPGLEVAPAGAATAPGRRPSNPFDRPGTATTVVSLPELGRNRVDPGALPRRHPSTQSWSGPDRTNSLETDGVSGRRKPVPKPRQNSDTSPPPAPNMSTSGADKKTLQYTGPIGPWFPDSPTSTNDTKDPPLPSPTELSGLTATKPGAHCISDDITRRPSIAHRYKFNEEHEAQCLSDDIQNGSLLAGQKGALPPGFFDGHRTACISDDLARVYLGLGEEGEQELQAQMEKEERSRAVERERSCLGDELSDRHTDRSGLIPVIEEEEGETPAHARPHTAEIPMVAEEADPRR